MIVACSNHSFNNWSVFEFPTTKTSILKQKSVLCVRITCHIEKIPPLCDWCQYVRQTWQTTSWITHLYVYMYVTSSSFIGCKIRCSLSTQIWIDWNGLQHRTVVQVHNYTLAVPYFGIKMVIGVSRSVCQSLIHKSSDQRTRGTTNFWSPTKSDDLIV